MKTKDLIQLLNHIDPSGENEVVIGNEPVFTAYPEPAYWDGRMQKIVRNEEGSAVKGIFTSKGQKITIRSYGIQDAIYDNPDFPVEFDLDTTDGEYQKSVDRWRAESRKIEEEFRKETMKTETEIIKNAAGIETHKGRWGYYPCSYETYLKLKRLNHFLMLSRIQTARWFRWGRKAEHNRTGEQPNVPPVFFYSDNLSFYEKNFSWTNHDKIVRSKKELMRSIEQDYANARYPKQTADEVTSLELRSERIDSMLSELEAFFGH